MYYQKEREIEIERKKYEYKDKNNSVVGDKQKRNYFREIQCRCERRGWGRRRSGGKKKEQKRR